MEKGGDHHAGILPTAGIGTGCDAGGVEAGRRGQRPGNWGEPGPDADCQRASQLFETSGGKGLFRCRKAGKLNIYTALVSEADYRRAESGAVLEKLYGGSLKAFAAALWDGGRLSGDDVRDLRSYLEELERRDP